MAAIEDYLDRLTHKQLHRSSLDGLGSGVAMAPASMLAYAQKTDYQTGIVSATDLTGLAITITVPAGRQIRLTGCVGMYPDVNNAVGMVTIMEGATQIAEAVDTLDTAGYGHWVIPSAIISPSAGTHTYKLQLQRILGTGNVNSYGAANKPCFFVAEDITGGPQPYAPASVPVGVLAQLNYSAGDIAITGTADFPGTSITFTVPAGRSVRLRAQAQVYANAASSWYVSIMESGVEIGRPLTFSRPDVGYATMNGDIIISPSAGSHTYYLRGSRFGGTGNLNIQAVPTIQFIAEDITPTPAPANSAPSSTLAYNEQSSTMSSVGTAVTDVTGLSVTVTVAAGRRLRIRSQVIVINGSAAANKASLGILEGATRLAFGEIGMVNSGTPGDSGNVIAEAIVSPSAGTHTYKASVQFNVGAANTIYRDPSFGQINFILVEDITGTGIAGHTHTELDDTGWIDLPFANGWTHYDTTTYGPCQYRKKAGVVYLRGLIKNGSSGSAILGTLPPGFRPGLEKMRVNGQSNELFCQYDIQGSTGSIIPVTGVNTAWASLNNISFIADR